MLKWGTEMNPFFFSSVWTKIVQTLNFRTDGSFLWTANTAGQFVIVQNWRERNCHCTRQSSPTLGININTQKSLSSCLRESFINRIVGSFYISKKKCGWKLRPPAPVFAKPWMAIIWKLLFSAFERRDGLKWWHKGKAAGNLNKLKLHLFTTLPGLQKVRGPWKMCGDSFDGWQTRFGPRSDKLTHGVSSSHISQEWVGRSKQALQAPTIIAISPILAPVCGRSEETSLLQLPHPPDLAALLAGGQ